MEFSLDPETATECWVRADGVAVAVYPDGVTMAKHADGTTMRTSADGLTILVESPGFASLEIGTEIVATDNGCIEMRPPSLWEGEAAHLPILPPPTGAAAHSSQPEPDKICGAYIFNCQKGVVEVEDPEFN